MATPIDLAALIQELQAASDLLGPQIKGLAAYSVSPLSPAALDIINRQYDIRATRSTLISAALAALIKLRRNGYPSYPAAVVTQDVMDELSEEATDVGTALNIFGVTPLASKVVVNLGAATPKGSP